MPKYIDAHCHIITPEQMRNATSRGVGCFIVNGTQPTDWGAIVEMVKQNNVHGAIGVHPWFVSTWSDDVDNQLCEMLHQNPNLMVGEIGLDKNRPDMETQEVVFSRQLQIAHDMKRIAHIHCVGAWGKMMEVLRGSKLPPAMVFHAFSGSPDLVPELVKMGAYFSFGHAVCDTRYAKMRVAVACVPENRILVESDAPDVCAHDTIPDTVAEIAVLRGVNAEQMATIIYNNTMGLLNDGKI